MTNAGVCVAANAVSFSYSSSAFMENVSVGFRAGALTCVIGPNGGGKSTLVGLCCGQLRPFSGTISACGADIHALTTKRRARLVAMLPQSNVVPPMSVFDLVGCGRFPHRSFARPMGKADYAAVDEAIEAVGLSDFRDVDVRSLSGGQRQRAFIAMTVAQDTPAVFFDEPATYLDARTSHEMMALLKTLSERGKTVVAVVHDIDSALRYADDIVLMERGDVVAAGSSGKVLESGAIGEVFGMELVSFSHGGRSAFAMFPLR